MNDSELTDLLNRLSQCFTDHIGRSWEAVRALPEREREAEVDRFVATVFNRYPGLSAK